MPPELAPMLVAIVMILTIGFIAVVRPIAKPLVRLFEAMINERERLPSREMSDIQRSLEQIEGRLHLMEERQSFYEALRAEPEAPQLKPSTGTTEAPTTEPQGGPSLV